MKSPNAFSFPSALVLVRDEFDIDSPIGGTAVLIESRRVADGIYFKYYSSHTIEKSLRFSQLASPRLPPRILVDTFIV